MRVCLGGTFDPIHDGHELLLRRAFEAGDEVLIGLTSDAMAAGKGRRIATFGERKRRLQEFIKANRWGKYVIAELNDRFGPAAHRADLDAIVVSEGTAPTALELNQARDAEGLKQLQVLQVPLVPAEDGLPISSTRIVKGDIDRSGRVLRKMRVFVGTENEVKVRAVKAVLSRIYSKVDVRRRPVESKVSPQPREEDAIKGALNRAREGIGDGDLGVGIEAGLVVSRGIGRDLDVQYCAIVDRAGRITIGSGPGFEHAPAVLEMVGKGRTVGEAMEALIGIRDIGKREGAIGYLTEGRMDRQQLTEIAVLMAMVPRIRRSLYA